MIWPKCTLDDLETLCGEHGEAVPTSHNQAVTSTINGPRTVEQLRRNLNALNLSSPVRRSRSWTKSAPAWDEVSKILAGKLQAGGSWTRPY